MKDFITNTIALCIITGLTAWGLDGAISKGLRQCNMPIYDNLTKINNGEIKADLIINGSSKALVQISPAILDSILNVNSYNLGLDGNPFIIQKLQFDLYQQWNQPPKTVIQVVSNGTLVCNQGELYEYIKWAPYLKNKLVQEATKKFKGFSWVDYHLPFFKYSGHPIDALLGILCNFGIQVSPATTYKGYLQKNLFWDKSFDKFKQQHPHGYNIDFDNESMRLFEEYIVNCKRKNIQLILVYPPTYHESQAYLNNREQIISYYIALSVKHQIPFLDYSQNELTLQKKYFYNSQHLNKEGAEIFSRQLGHDIKSNVFD